MTINWLLVIIGLCLILLAVLIQFYYSYSSTPENQKTTWKMESENEYIKDKIKSTTGEVIDSKVYREVYLQ